MRTLALATLLLAQTATAEPPRDPELRIWLAARPEIRTAWTYGVLATLRLLGMRCAEDVGAPAVVRLIQERAANGGFSPQDRAIGVALVAIGDFGCRFHEVGNLEDLNRLLDIRWQRVPPLPE
jgi:hypothetical protein